MSDKNELKPCPFCGGNAQVTYDTEPDGCGDRYDLYGIECQKCRIRIGSWTLREVPIKMWNTRTEMPNDWPPRNDKGNRIFGSFGGGEESFVLDFANGDSCTVKRIKDGCLQTTMFFPEGVIANSYPEFFAITLPPLF